MSHSAEAYESRRNAAPAFYTSNIHGETTHIEVYTRIPDAVIRSLHMGQMEMIRMRSGSVAIRRNASEIRGRGLRMSTFILQVEGRTAFKHYGNQITLEEGDFTLCDNNTEYEFRCDGPNEVLMFRVPTSLVKESIPTPDFLCGQRLAKGESLASTAAAMARDLAAKDDLKLPSETRERAGRHLLDVLASSYAAMLDDRMSTSAIMSGRFWKVKLFIEEHLRDPDLSPSLIARKLQLSDRYLRMIFAVSDESPSAYILRRRLEECARQLRDPRWRSHSITDIAFSWGFNSAPHFARSFRTRFESSPRDYRQQQVELA
ncbi:helix-turn-helix domain-containing protein [Sphingobium nicotianae]|uniref:Helix-turn-helix domain-containing protein n=1 Tax=Sphingobium nicotianae TaxID=2782607 RepID=A0A9X1DDZ9_9SPHN|nr:helix-turn-helix domain-containing protein [Sphingobium nicotianae]MBT2188243.1 helix-turn-helix domain-containing protein [Sphingobium nicotianae]